MSSCLYPCVSLLLCLSVCLSLSLSFQPHDRVYRLVSFHPLRLDMMAAVVEHTVEFFDMGTGERHPKCHKQMGNALELDIVCWLGQKPSNTNKILLFTSSNSFDSMIYAYDFGTGKVVATFTCHRTKIVGLASSHVATTTACGYFASAGSDGIVALFSYDESRCLGKIRTIDSIPVVIFDPNYPTVFVVGAGSTVSFFSITALDNGPFRSAALPVQEDSPIIQLAFSPDARQLAILCRSGDVWVLDAFKYIFRAKLTLPEGGPASDKPLDPLQTIQPQLSFSPDG
ncbi:hypothetical protein KIPB_011624, partial [Kipferlia bialata]|eukprot:g11624.t1